MVKNTTAEKVRILSNRAKKFYVNLFSNPLPLSVWKTLVDKPVEIVEKFCFSTAKSDFSMGISLHKSIHFSTRPFDRLFKIRVTETGNRNRFQFFLGEIIMISANAVALRRHFLRRQPKKL